MSLISDEITVRIRYGETDQMGVVYHGNYAQFLEMGRVEWLRKLGVSYKKMEADGIMLPVVSLQLDFKKPATYDDLLSIKTTLLKMPSVRIEFSYQIFNEKREIITSGKTVLAFIKMSTGKPVKCPDFILDKLKDEKF